MLLQGADPGLVCPALLRAAASSDENGAACARLIRIAGRMQRMQLPASTAHASLPPAPQSLPASATRTAPMTRLIGRFTRGNDRGTTSVPEGPITGALLQYDIPAATQALEKARRPPRKFNAKRHEDRLIGMLALNDTKNLDAWHKKGLLQHSLQTVGRPGLKALLKEFPYSSPKRGRSSWRSINGAVTFHDSRQKIMCRHLAVYWLLHRPRLENGKIDYATFSSKKRLKEAFKAENEHAFEYYLDNCTNSHVVENAHWGAFLATQFREMQQAACGDEPRRILICSYNHVIACELKIKQGADGEPLFRLNFYDPNRTASHRRVRTQDLASIESLSMAKLINDERRCNRYYKNQSVSVALVIPDEMPRPTRADSLSASKENIANRQLSSRPGMHTRPIAASGSTAETAQGVNQVNAGYVFHMLTLGFAGELPHIFAAVEKIPDKTLQVEVLSARGNRGSSALCCAIAVSYENTVSNFTRGVLAMRTLSGDQKATVLCQTTRLRADIELTAFQTALLANRARIVAALTCTVLASDLLTLDQKCRVLRTKTKDKKILKHYPNLDCAKASKAFVDAVNAFNLPPGIRTRLLQDVEMAVLP